MVGVHDEAGRPRPLTKTMRGWVADEAFLAGIKVYESLAPGLVESSIEDVGRTEGIMVSGAAML